MSAAIKEGPASRVSKCTTGCSGQKIFELSLKVLCCAAFPKERFLDRGQMVGLVCELPGCHGDRRIPIYSRSVRSSTKGFDRSQCSSNRDIDHRSRDVALRLLRAFTLQ